jgi:membrane-bound lytic murein transglycosylase D
MARRALTAALALWACGPALARAAEADGGSAVAPITEADYAEEVARACEAAGSQSGTRCPGPGDLAPAVGEDEPVQQEKIDQASEELEAMKAAESQVQDPGAGSAELLFRNLERLPACGPLAGRRADFESPQREYLPFLPALPSPDAALALQFDIDKAKAEYDIPVELRPEVAQWINFYQHAGRKYFVWWLGRSTRYIPVMRDILRQEGLPEDTVYLAMIESGFSTLAYSWAAASGPWQFIDATGKRFGLKNDFWMDERRDPIKSTRAASRYLRELHEQFGDWYLAWAGYNSGAGTVQKGMVKWGAKDFWEMCDAHKGRFLKAETKNYVPKLIAAALVSKHPQAFGFSPDEVPWQQPIETEEIEIPDPTDIAVVAKAAECDLEDIKTLNPELRRWLTPPTEPGKPYIMRVPKGHRELFAVNFPKVAPKEHLVFRIHRVKKGDTLSKISHEYHSFSEMIMRMNGIASSKKLRVGNELMIPVAGQSEWAQAEKAEKEGKPKKIKNGFTPVAATEEIPAGTPAPTVKKLAADGKEQQIYAVEAKDSLWYIAKRFGVTVEELKEWNGLSGERPKLSIGQELVLVPRAELKADAKATAKATAKAEAKPAPAKPEAPKADLHPKGLDPKADALSKPAPKPEPKPAPKVASKGTKKKRINHTLVKGDTLWTISKQYGVSVDDIKKANALNGKKPVLKVGKTLIVDVADDG